MKNETVTNYMEIAVRQTKFENLKKIAGMIVSCAIEDADIEFFENDFNVWLELRKKRNKSAKLKYREYKEEFKFKQIYKEALFDILGFNVYTSDIPKKFINERKLYEDNDIKTLVKETSYEKNTLINIAKMHGWKIGLNYKKPTIFDL